MIAIGIVVVIVLALGYAYLAAQKKTVPAQAEAVSQILDKAAGGPEQITPKVEEIKIESDDELKKRIDKKVDSVGNKKVGKGLVEEIDKLVKQVCAFPKHPKLGCGPDYEPDPESEMGCCKIKGKSVDKQQERINMAKQVGVELIVSSVASAVMKKGLEKALTKAMGSQATKMAAKAAAKKAAAKAAKQAAKKAAQRGASKAAQKAAAKQAAKQAAKKAAQRAAKKAAQKAAQKVAQKAAQKAAVKAGAKVATAVAASGAKAATASAAGPPGMVAAAVMLMFDVVSIALDIIDVSGYETYTSQSVLDKARIRIDADGYKRVTESGDSEWPLLFPIPEYAKDEFNAASEFMTTKMFEEYVMPNVPKDPIAGPAWAKFMEQTIASLDGSAAEPKMPQSILDFGAAIQKKYHKERDKILFEKLKQLLPPEKAKGLELVDVMSTPKRIGITITADAAAAWNTSNTPKWLKNNDFFKPPDTAVDYLDPTMASYTDHYFEINKGNPGDPKAPNLIKKSLPKKLVLGRAYGPLVAYCLKRRQNSEYSKAVEPQKLGVTFNFESGVCNFTKAFCRRYGLVFKNNDCSTQPGQGFAEMIFGKTVTRGVIRGYQSKVIDNFKKGDPLSIAKGLYYANPGTLIMHGIGEFAIGEIMDTKAKESKPAKKRPCSYFGARLRDDGTSCWLDTVPKKSSITKKYPCSRWDYKHGKLRDDGTSCWKDTIPIKSSMTKKRSCSHPSFKNKYGKLRDDGTSCWKDTIAKKSRPASKRSCKHYEKQYGKLRDDGTSCWRDAKGRGAGRPMTCKSSEDKKGALCYPKCRSGYSSRALECEGSCPSGSRNTGLTCLQRIHAYIPGNRCSKPWKKCFYQRAPCRAGYRYRGSTCNQSCKPGFRFRSGAAGSAFCDKGRNRYSRAGKSKPLNSCPSSRPQKDAGLCYKRCGAGMKGRGPMCHPRNGVGIKKNLFQRQYCPPGQRNVAGVCWTKCPSGYKDIGALCHPKGGPGIKVPVWKREYCGPMANQPPGQDPKKPRMRKRILGVCWDQCPDKYKKLGAICEPPGGPGIRVKVWDREHCGPSSFQPPGQDPKNPKLRKKVAGVCWDQCPREVVPGNKDKMERLGKEFETVNKNFEAMRKKVNDMQIKYDKQIAEGDTKFMDTKTELDALKREEEKIRTEKHAPLELSYTNEVAEYKRNYKYGYKDIGALCEPKGGPGIKVDLFKRYYCPPGWKNVAGICWKSCPPGYRDDGATCNKN